LKELCDLYLGYQNSKVMAGDLSPKHYNDQISSLEKLMSFVGPDRETESISTMDLQNYKRKLQRAYYSAHRLNLHISIMKAMFHWARKNDITETIPNIDAISRCKVIHQEKYTFTSEQIKKLVLFADVQMRAMIWLGLNCGFGCTDCGLLKWTDLDFDNSRVNFARNKTGVSRNLPLWPETIRALNEVPRSGPLVFYSPQGHPWIGTLTKTEGDGACKYTPVNRAALSRWLLATNSPNA